MTRSFVISLVLLILAPHSADALVIKHDHPYVGAIAVDAATGEVLFEDNADAKGYPASVVKLMGMLLILEAVESGRVSLDDSIVVTREAERMGGSQVYLERGEVFPVEELLYAMIVRSANDATVALAIHVAGSKDAFVDMMNARARDLGMINTVFQSVHGLPPNWKQLPDVSTARDIAKLCRELLRMPAALKYTSTKRRLFRTNAEEPFIMDNHNPLLKTIDGCDGLKTGFFYAAGFSIAATAERNGKRAVVVILGAQEQRTRDRKAKKILVGALETLEKRLVKIPPGLSDALNGVGHVDSPENSEREE
jgi:D-alanyl-D-alanine carboxypeptidase (penicillin-binding protein 5/6)